MVGPIDVRRYYSAIEDGEAFWRVLDARLRQNGARPIAWLAGSVEAHF